MFVILLAVAVFSWANAQLSDLHPQSDEFIDLINSGQDSWVAGRNFPPNTPLEYLKASGGCYKPSGRHKSLPEKIYDADFIASLPDSFDSRQKWPFCPSLNEIRDQADCGSCWVFGSVEAMTDRICIHSKGNIQKRLSAEEPMCCAKSEGKDGCHGGDPFEVYDYWIKQGIVTGGAYNSKQGCQPYTIPPQAINNNNTYNAKDFPPCQHKCIPGYKIPFDKDKSFGKSVYRLNGEDQMKAEIYNNGPISVGMDEYKDLGAYKDGVYVHSSELSVLDGHCVKIIGWGEERGRKYWLVANSWGTWWGMNGYFKILRGTNECKIEDTEVIAGLPKY